MFIHSIPPIFSKDSEKLILGSFPSVISRERQFFYANDKNRFWRVIAEIYRSDLPSTIDKKTELILKNRLALWDVIYSCDIENSADASIKNVTANDIAGLITKTNIKKIFVNGGKAFELYNKLVLPKVGIEAVKLPSTSPLNAAMKTDDLIDKWKIILQ